VVTRSCERRCGGRQYQDGGTKLKSHSHDALFREGAENGRVTFLSLRHSNIIRPNAAKYLHRALCYMLCRDEVWNTTADGIAEYYVADHYDKVSLWIAGRRARA
jgi:hypothetical protein